MFRKEAPLTNCVRCKILSSPCPFGTYLDHANSGRMVWWKGLILDMILPQNNLNQIITSMDLGTLRLTVSQITSSPKFNSMHISVKLKCQFVGGSELRGLD